MITVAITGGMGCGKSAASEALRKAGADAIFSADFIACEILDSDRDVKRDVVALLGDSVIAGGKPAKDGEFSLDRKKIAERVFSDAELLKKYESIIYSSLIAKILEAGRAFSPAEEDAHCAHGERVVCVEVPLLFEKKLEKFFDIRLAVFCSEELRLHRLEERGMSLPEIKSRDAFQLPPVKKAELADIVLFNESDVGFLERQASEVLYRLKSNG